MTMTTAHLTIAHWRDDYNTGDARIDQEHQALFELVNTLHDAIQHAASLPHLAALVATMADHTVEHFRHEEALMQAYGYPGYDRHKQVHNNLLAKVTALLTKLRAGEDVVGSDLTGFLTEWLAHHIRGEDQSMIRFLQSRMENSAF